MHRGSRVALSALTVVACVCGTGWVGQPWSSASACAEESEQGITGGHPFDQRPQPWQRRDEPVLSAHFTKRSWCRVVLYSPTVLYKDGVFKIWYVGTSTGSRSTDMALGHAESTDGIHWKRAEKPAVQVSGESKSCIYPFVLEENGRYYMWYGCHRAGGIFEIFCATSPDGSHWTVDHERAAFPASRDRDRFDGRYTSIPSVLSFPDRYMMYYAPRDWNNTYVMPDGTKGHDGAGVYSHIGVAVIPK